jgi:hypothetical protein
VKILEDIGRRCSQERSEKIPPPACGKGGTTGGRDRNPVECRRKERGKGVCVITLWNNFCNLTKKKTWYGGVYRTASEQAGTKGGDALN